MLRHVAKLIYLTVVVASIIIVDFVSDKQDLKAQSSSNNMQELLEDLSQRMYDSADFLITFQFRDSLTQSGDIWMNVPVVSDYIDITIEIEKIGIDHVCFQELSGSGFSIIRCTPYSNIVSISYSEL